MADKIQFAYSAYQFWEAFLSGDVRRKYHVNIGDVNLGISERELIQRLTLWKPGLITGWTQGIRVYITRVTVAAIEAE